MGRCRGRRGIGATARSRLAGGQAVTAEVSGPDAGKFFTGDVVTAGWSAADTYPLSEDKLQ